MTALITGGAASGKSAMAEKLVTAQISGRIAYAATMQIYDGESEARVARHRLMRRDKGFETLECPFGLPQTQVLRRYDALLLECVSNLAANVLYAQNQTPGEAVKQIVSDIERLFDTVGRVVIVSNEVFSDNLCYNDFTRAYIGVMGTLNQKIARRADAVVESVCGIPVVHKGREVLTGAGFF